MPAKERQEDPRRRPSPARPRSTPAVSACPRPARRPADGSGRPVGAGGTRRRRGLKLDQADFKYPVYIERMVMVIGLNWFKPAQSGSTNPVVHFQIERDGTITDARIVTSSGLALRRPGCASRGRRVLAASPAARGVRRARHLGIQVCSSSEHSGEPRCDDSPARLAPPSCRSRACPPRGPGAGSRPPPPADDI